MFGLNQRDRARLGGLAALSVLIAAAAPVSAAGRDLSGYVDPTTTFTVTITLDAPPGTIAAGVEDTPPAGWTASNISDSGAWDSMALKVKWGPFFDPSIPTAVTYDVTPSGAGGEQCFSGIVSFDGDEQAIGGDACVGGAVPSIAAWGLASLAASVLSAGTIIIRRGASRRLV
jgi:hypothetical protein